MPQPVRRFTMVFSLRNDSGKLIVIIFSLLVVVLVIHQLNAAEGFAFSGQLSESLEIINRCSPNSPEIPNHSDGVADVGLPNIIHQIWRTNDVRTYSTELEASPDLWKAMLKPINYTVKLWTDDDVLQLLKAKYNWLLSTYKGYPQNIQRADLARLVVVHAEGGIYADLDVYPRDATQIQCLQHLGLQAIFAPTAGNLGLSNHFFMAERESSFLQWALCEAKRRGGAESRRILLPYLQVFWTTGPMMVTAAFRDYAWLYGTQRQNLGLLDERYEQAVIQHAAGRSWHGSDGKVLNYMADHVQMTVLMSLFILIILFGLVCGVRKRCYKYRGLFAYGR
jgi:mannosyltransferase OCH1-like enzyme